MMDKNTKTFSPTINVGGKMRTVVGKYVADASQIETSNGKSVEERLNERPAPVPGGEGGGSANVDRLATNASMGYKVLVPGSALSDIRTVFTLKVVSGQTQKSGTISVQIAPGTKIALACDEVQKKNEKDLLMFTNSKDGSIVYKKGDNYFHQETYVQLTEDEMAGATFNPIKVFRYADKNVLTEALQKELATISGIYSTMVDGNIRIKVLKLGRVEVVVENTSGAIIEKIHDDVEETINPLSLLDVEDDNTIYEIREGLDLNGEKLTMPQNCAFYFNGGSLRNGIIKGNNTRIDASLLQIFETVKFDGSFICEGTYPEWFGVQTKLVTSELLPNNGLHDADDLSCSADAIQDAIRLSKLSNAHVFLGSYLYRTNKTVLIPNYCTVETTPRTVIMPYLAGDGLNLITQDEENSTLQCSDAFVRTTLGTPAMQIACNQFIETKSMAKAFEMTSVYCSLLGKGYISLINSKYTIGVYVRGTGYNMLDMNYLSPHIDISVVGGVENRNTPDTDSKVGEGNPAPPTNEETAKLVLGDTYWDKKNNKLWTWINKWLPDGTTNNEYNTSLRIEVPWGDCRIINPQICIRDMYGYRGIEIIGAKGGWFNKGKWSGSVSVKAGNYVSVYTNYDVTYQDMSEIQMQYGPAIVSHDMRMVFCIRGSRNKFPFPWDLGWSASKGKRLRKAWELGKHSSANIVPYDDARYYEDRGDNIADYIFAPVEKFSKVPLIPVEDHGKLDTDFIITPNIYHKWGVLINLKIQEAIDAPNNSLYMFEFLCGDKNSTKIEFPEDWKWENGNTPKLVPNRKYQIGVFNKVAKYVELAYSYNPMLLKYYSEMSIWNLGGYITFADKAIEQVCARAWGSDGFGISKGEAEQEHSLDGKTGFRSNKNISTFNELQQFTNTTFYGGSTFQDSSIKEISLSPKMVIIPATTFYGCNQLVKISNTNNITKIERQAFFGTSIDVVDFPGLTDLGEGAFGRSKIKRIKSLGKITIIPKDCFANCTELTDVAIPKGLTTLSRTAFYFCKKLVKIDLPDTITIIDYFSLFDIGLADIIVRNITPPTLDPQGIKNPKAIYVPDTSVDAYKAAPVWSNFSEKIKPLSTYVPQ